MLVSLYYRPDCLKSAFYRIVLREMTWEVTEFDVTLPSSAEQLKLLKKDIGNSVEPIYPAIFSSEAYPHEILPTIEYWHERNPSESMYPEDPITRLFSRSLLYRSLRTVVPMWDDILKNQSLGRLVAFTDEHEELLSELIKKPSYIRSGSFSMPSYVEILFALVYLRKQQVEPISNLEIKKWLKKMAARESFQAVIPQFLQISS